ncbi:RNA-directed DNA polymerase, eukaryota, Reverse transcriptase zinc-binding domain protein [Artemisia annua]|uniref:RNA-directed DNA polymerase, eukaryota, Reverse transcriptase zinc-binding domain protein n=1 Tax=Artemisia annua TaxID=35608 RepID=A0A2U1MX66_ARTAN|nr:RNA-directed DNA polymerase, eukaryota, Reverse transcriptase zinc-binding domain protein [Artemisia annua]
MCDECKVFGHARSNCKLHKEKDNCSQNVKNNESTEMNEMNKGKPVDNRKQGIQREGYRVGLKGRYRQPKYVYQAKQAAPKSNSETDTNGNNNSSNDDPKVNSEATSKGNNSPIKSWNVQESVISEMRKSANKYNILQDDVDDNELNNNEEWKKIVDKYVLLKQKPAGNVVSEWSKQMHLYYKRKWDAMYDKGKQQEENVENIELDGNDVFIDKSGTTRFISENENEVRKLIRNENLSVCAVLETHMKKDRIGKVGERLFGNWNWQNNIHVSKKGCRIMVGWDNNKVECNLIHCTGQAMLYLIEVFQTHIKFFCTFIYAANSGRDKRELWKDLHIFKQLINNEA